MLLTRAEVAARLRVHEATVDRYIKRGLIGAIKGPGPNGTVRIPEEALDDYLAAHAIATEGEPGRAAAEAADVDMHVRDEERAVPERLPDLRQEQIGRSA